MLMMSSNGREFEKKNERWKIIICRGRVENGREFEVEEQKMEESLRRKSGSWQIITIFEKTERKMEESLRRKSGSWQRLLQYLGRQSGIWKTV
jgi:hypothetical protein